MAISTVKSGLDSISNSINSGKQRVDALKESLEAVATDLNSLPTTYADAIAEIGALESSDANDVYIDELAQLTTEFQALVAAINTAVAAL